MMIKIEIQGLQQLTARVDNMGKQARFAAANALTKTAQAVERKVQSGMAGAFKSASPFVKRATFVQGARKDTLTATVGLKDQKPSGGTAPAVLLKEHFTGGLRGNKPFEKAIASLGASPQGYRAIPGGGMKLDAFGNPNRKLIGEMLGALRNNRQVWNGRGKNVVLTGYFVVRVGDKSHLHPGIYYRPNKGAIKCLFVFVARAAYRKAIDLERIARDVVAGEFQQNFDHEFADAMRTAR